jgi:HAD superfamily phosphatase
VSKELIVFDMDGVLVDVKESYREAIRATVAAYTDEEPSHELIQQYKNRGGWNNDWKLSQELLRVAGHEVDYEEVVEIFNSFFFGMGGVPGLMEREKWIDDTGVLERLAARYDLAIFTGRLREEAWMTLRRYGTHIEWFAVMGDDDVTQSKPAPDGLLTLGTWYARPPIYYVGDTVDDARASAAANVPFIAITAPGGDFQDLPVAHRLHSINEMEGILLNG